MRVKSILISLVCFVLFFSMPIIAQNNLSVQELKDQHAYYTKVVSDPNIFWMLSLNDGDNLGTFISRERFEAMVTSQIMLLGDITMEQKVAAMTYHINASQKVKADLRRNMIPNLEFLIRERANSPNPNINLNDNTYHSTNNDSSSNSSFDSVLSSISSDQHLSDISYDNVISEEFHSEPSSSQCPEWRPNNYSGYRYDTNNNPNDNTYNECNYFKNGRLSYQMPYVNGQKNGIVLKYNDSPSYMLAARLQYSNGKKNGIEEMWMANSKSGHIWRTQKNEYTDGLKHGEQLKFHENGVPRRSVMMNYGKATYNCSYDKNGKQLSCASY